MSHVVAVNLEVRDLIALATAAEYCDLLKVETTKWDWYGRFMDDYDGEDTAQRRLGVSPDTYGDCLFALVQRDSPLGLAEADARAGDRHLTHAEATAIRGSTHGYVTPYSIGVVADPRKEGSYALLYDFYQGGFGLKDKVLEQANKLRQSYGVAAARRAAGLAGHRVASQRMLDGGYVELKMQVPAYAH